MFNELLILLVASSYVFAIYYRQPIDLLNKDRNNIDVIHFRFQRVTKLCFALLIFIPLIYKDSILEDIKKFGFIPGYTKNDDLLLDLNYIGFSLKFILILFSSSIFQILIKDQYLDIKSPFIYPFRDYIFAPITEELIYRGIILLITNENCPEFLKYTPYLFGIAHFHHALHIYNRHTHTLQQILISTIFQFGYTSIFGYLANWIYLKTNNLMCCIIIHSICNLFGFPTLSLNNRGFLLNLIYYSLIVYGLYHSYIVFNIQ